MKTAISVLLLFAASVHQAFASPAAQAQTASAVPVMIVDDHFVRDGKPYQIISGSIHYVRVPRPYWRDRLQKARAMGLNTIETYAFWNLHEPKPGVFDFSGQLDIAAFIRMAQRRYPEARQAALLLRQGLTMKVGYVNDDLIKNKQTIVAEMRAGVAVFRPPAFCEVTSLN